MYIGFQLSVISLHSRNHKLFALFKITKTSISGHTFHDSGDYIHLKKKDVAHGALLLGAGVLKGVILTGLINNADNGITIGKK